MSDDQIRKAASILGRKGGKAGGKSKARTGISERMKAWWASPAAAHRRKKTKPKLNYAQETYAENNPHPNYNRTTRKLEKNQSKG
jgi:hypothetical protein